MKKGREGVDCMGAGQGVRRGVGVWAPWGMVWRIGRWMDWKTESESQPKKLVWYIREDMK